MRFYWKLYVYNRQSKDYDPLPRLFSNKQQALDYGEKSGYKAYFAQEQSD
jgi:hypothetical protein